MRRLGKIALYGVALLVLLGVVAYIARDLVRDTLIHIVSAQVSQALRGSLEIGALRGSLWRSLILRDVVLRDTQEELGRIDELRLTYTPWTLLRGHLTVSLEIVHPQVTLAQEPDGAWNLQRVLPPANPDNPPASGVLSPDLGLPFAVTLERLQLRGGQVTLRLPSLPGVQQVTGLEMRAHGRVDHEGTRVQLEALTAQTTPAEVDIQTLRGAFEWLTDRMQIDKLHLQTGQTLVTASGMLPYGGQIADLEVQVQPLDGAEIGRLLHDAAWHGQLRSAFTVQGPPAAVVLDGYVSTTGGRIDLQGEVDTTATPVGYQGTVQVIHVNLADLLQREALQSDLNAQLLVTGVGAAPGDMRGSVQLDIQPSHLGRITLRPSHVHLEAHQQRFQVKQLNLDTSVARMMATGVIDLTGTSALQYELTANLDDLQDLVGTQDLSGAIRLQGQAEGELTDLKAHGTLDVSNLRYHDNSLQTLRLTYAGAQLGAQPQISAQLRAQQAQVGTLPVAQAAIDATYDGAKQQVRFSADVTQSSRYSGKAQGTVTLRDTSQQVVLDDVQIRLADHTWQAAAPLEVVLGEQQVDFKQVRLAHADESIELSGSLAGAALHDLRLQATQIDLTFLQRLVPLPELVQGRGTLTAQLTGTRAMPQIQAAVQLQPAAQQRLPFEQLQATLTYAQRQLQAAVQIQQEKRTVLDLNLQAPVDLALTALPVGKRLVDAPLTAQLTLERPNLAALSRQAGFPSLEGTFAGKATMQGHYATLNVDAQVQLQQLGLAGAVERLSGPLNLQATLVTAASVPDLAQALSQGTLTPEVRTIVLRVPTLEGQLPATDDKPPQRFQVRDVVAQAAAQMTNQGVQATLEQLTVQVQFADLPSAHLLLAAGITPQRLDVTRLQVRLPHSEVRGSGYLTLPDQQVQVRLDIPRLRLDELALQVPANLPQELQGVINVHGSLLSPEVEARLQYAGAQVVAELTAQLQERVPRYRGTLRLDGFEINRLLPEERGQLQIQLLLQGRGFDAAQRRAHLDVRINAPDFTLAPRLDIRVLADLTGDTVRLEEVRVRSTPVTLTASGTVSTTERVDVTYAVTLGDLTPLQAHLGASVQAQGGLTGTLRGTLQALQAQGTFVVRDWRYNTLQGTRVQADFTAANLPASPQATLTAQILGLQSGTALPATSLRLESRYAAQQGTVQVAVTDGPFQHTMLDGQVVLGETLRVTLNRLHLQRQQWAWDNTAPIEVVRRPQGDVEINRLLLRNGQQTLRVQGRLAADGVLNAALSLQQLQIQPAVQALAPDVQIPDGQLTLDLTLSGTLQQPQATGQVHLRDLQWQQQALGEINGTLNTTGSALGLNMKWHTQQAQLLQVNGSIGLDDRQALALQVRLPNVDLALLEPFSDAIQQSGGTLDGDLQLIGTVQQPGVQGYLALRDGELRLTPTGERYRDIQARLDFTGNRVDITRLQVGSRSGTLTLTGWAETADLTVQKMALDLRAKEFTALHTRDIEAIVSADVTAQGSLQELHVTGTVQVPNSQVRLSAALLGGQKPVEPWQLTVAGVYGAGPQAATAEAVSPTAAASDPLAFLTADVTIDIPQNAWVRGPGTAVELRGNVRVKKEREGPFVLGGTVQTVRGFASFYGKRFTLEEGHVTFTGARDINPALNVTALYQASGYDVSVQVGGRAKQPTINLSSTPELPQTDIVSLLLVGRTTDRLTNSEQQNFSGKAQQAVGNVAAAAVGQQLGLDTVSVESGDTSGSSKVNVGRYVTQDLFLSYERQLGKEASNTIGVEYSINRRLKLRGTGSDTGESALDVLWRIEY